VAGAGNVTRGAGLRPRAKALDKPPDPTVGAPVLDPTWEGVGAKLPHATRLLHSWRPEFPTMLSGGMFMGPLCLSSGPSLKSVAGLGF
jgi:hypothetical protein